MLNLKNVIHRWYDVRIISLHKLVMSPELLIYVIIVITIVLCSLYLYSFA